MKDKLPPLLLLLASACGPTSIGTSSETSSETSTEQPADTDEDSSEDSSDEPKVDEPIDFDCDPFEQDCPAGWKCAPYASSGASWDANKCVPVGGDQTPGEPCIYAGAREGTDDCDATSMCWNVEEVNGELVGECVPFCEGSPEQPECPEGSRCPLSGDSIVNICIPICDPLAQDCDAGLGCYWSSTEFLCATTTLDIPLGEPCGFINDCAAGLFCAVAESLPECNGASCCAAFCDLELGDSQCEGAPGTSCVPFFEAGRAPRTHEHVGVCVVP